MKKIISLALVGVMALSMVPTVLATTDYTNGTKVEYAGQGSAQYTITVPALLAPGGEGNVTLQGTWASDETVKVTADKTVTLTNSINANDQKILDVTFAGIEKAGDNTQTVQAVEAVSVSDISNALFGTWNGKFNYNVEIVNVVAAGCDTLYWDGNTDGLESVPYADTGLTWYRVSDVVPATDDVSNGVTFCMTNPDGTQQPFTVDAAIMQNMIKEDGCFATEFFVIGVPTDNYPMDDALLFPKKGVYFALAASGAYVSKFVIPNYTGFPHSDGCGH